MTSKNMSQTLFFLHQAHMRYIQLYVNCLQQPIAAFFGLWFAGKKPIFKKYYIRHVQYEDGSISDRLSSNDKVRQMSIQQKCQYRKMLICHWLMDRLFIIVTQKLCLVMRLQNNFAENAGLRSKKVWETLAYRYI